MEHPKSFLKRVEQYQRAKGWSDATLGNKVANSATWLPRIRNRIASFEADMRRFQAQMSRSPAVDPADEDAA